MKSEAQIDLRPSSTFDKTLSNSNARIKNRRTAVTVEESSQIIETCSTLHRLCCSAKRHRFPFVEEEVPRNGIYVLFEKGEYGHQADRIVRIGSHTGKDQLRSRIRQHFLIENKDKSIFRKNIGRAILNQDDDPFLEQWEYCLTSRKNKSLYAHLVDFEKQKIVEKKVSQYIRKSFTFSCIKIEDKNIRLMLEAKMISTVSWCKVCRPSKHWLGQFSPKEKIRKSGLWLVNHLYRSPLNDKELEYIESCIVNS